MMKKYLTIVSLFLLLLGHDAHSQLTLIDTRFVVLTNNGSDFDVKVQIRTNSSSAQLGTSTFVFRFDHTVLSYPLNPGSGTDFSFYTPFNGTTYVGDVDHNVRGNGQHEISLDVVYNSFTSGNGLSIGQSWIDLVGLQFSTLNSSASAVFSWDTAAFYSPVYGDTTGLPPGHWWFKGSWADLSPTPLPVELISFSAYNQDDHVHLHWETATELNNFGFEVQRMEEGGEWRPVGFVAGKGTVFYPQIYDWDDWLDNLDVPLSQQQLLRYRLKQMDRDGSYEYSPVVDVAFTPLAGPLSLEVYPSPCTDRAVASLRLSEQAAVTAGVFDVTGKLLISVLEGASLAAGNHAVTLPVQTLTPGVYLLRVSAPTGTTTKRFVVGR